MMNPVLSQLCISKVVQIWSKLKLELVYIIYVNKQLYSLITQYKKYTVISKFL